MIDENKTAVEVTSAPGFATPAVLPGFVFTTFCFVCWYWEIGLASGTAVALSFGIVQCCLFIGFFVGAIIFLRRGEANAGQVYGMFAVAFAGCGGVGNIVSYLSVAWGFSYDPMPFAMVNLVSGIVLLLALPSYVHENLVTVAINLLPAIALVLLGLNGGGWLAGTWPVPVAGWLFFFTGICGFIVIANTLNEGFAQIPLGPVLFKKK